MKKRVFWLALILLTLLGYAAFIEPFWIKTNKVTIHDDVLCRAWQGLRIMHLSDLHSQGIGRRERHILTLIKKLHPDLILLSGDYTQWRHNPAGALTFLKKLSAPLGVYGVLGDSDDATNRQKCLYCHPGRHYKKRIRRPFLLQDEVVRLKWHGHEIKLAGLSPDGKGNVFAKKLLGPTADHSEPILVLSHFGRIWSELPNSSPSLWLVGDTHGGQIKMPVWFWKIIKYKPDPDHFAGLFSNGHGSFMYVNRGIGTTLDFPFRLGVRPEVVMIKFKPGVHGQ